MSDEREIEERERDERELDERELDERELEEELEGRVIGRRGLVGVGLVAAGVALGALAFGGLAFGGGTFRAVVAILAGALVVAGGLTVRRDLAGARLHRASQGKIIAAALVATLVVTAIWVPIYLSRRPRPAPHGEPPIDRAASVAILRAIDGPLGTILAALPKDTTGLAALRVRQIAALEALPLDAPGFERLTAILEKARACGVDAMKDVELVVFAQRQHSLGSQRTGDPGDARNVVFLHGAIVPATLERCAGQLGSEVATRWLTKDILVLARTDAGKAYLDELQVGGQQLFDNALFVQHAGHLSADALAWGWMDTQAMQRSVPKEPLPKTFFGTIGAGGAGTLQLALYPIFRDEPLAKAVAKQWRAYSNGLPAGALGRGFQYTRTGTILIARLEVPLARVTEMAAMAASMIQGQ